RRCAVFTGGFSLEATEAVCDLDGGIIVLDGLTSLADASLLVRTELEGEPRLAMLETIREYALAELAQTSEGPELRARHARPYAPIVEEMDGWVKTRKKRLHLGRVLADADNIRAALAWAVDEPSGELTARMVPRLNYLWFAEGWVTEAKDWAQRVA